MPFFLGLYDLPGAGASNPNYDLTLMAKNAVQRCELHPNNELKREASDAFQTRNPSPRILTISAASSA